MLNFKGNVIALECNNALAGRVDKGDARCVEHEPFAGCTVECIAHYGTIEPVLVGCMDAQLMGAARNGLKVHDSTLTAITLNSADDLVTCYGRLAIDGIDLLARTVVVIGCKGQFNGSFALNGHTIKYGGVQFLDLATGKGALQFLVDLH